MENKQILLSKFGLILVGLILINLLFLQLVYLSAALSLILFIILAFLYQSIKTTSLNTIELDYAKNSIPDRQDINLILSIITDLLTEHVKIIDTEIEKANTLILNAVQGIFASFIGLKNLSDEQQRMLSIVMSNIQEERLLTQRLIEELTRADTRITSIEVTSTLASKDRINSIVEQFGTDNIKTSKVIDELAELSPKIAELVAVGVRSLQFEDLTRQTLTSLKYNIQTIFSLTDVIKEYERSNNCTYHQLHLLLQQCQKLIEQSQDKDNQKRVSQSSMDEGDVELF
jgi:hypothetical protein